MARRRLVHEVLSLSPEQNSKIILDLLYEALQKTSSDFESSLRSIGDDVKVSFSSIIRGVFRRHSTLGTNYSHVRSCHLRTTKIQNRFGRRNYGFDRGLTFQLDENARGWNEYFAWMWVLNKYRVERSTWVHCVFTVRVWRMSKHFYFDSRFQHPFTSYIAGPTQSGKPFFVFELIDFRSVAIFPPPERIVWCYGEYHDASFCHRSDKVEFVEGLTDVTLLDSRRILFFT